MESSEIQAALRDLDRWRARLADPAFRAHLEEPGPIEDDYAAIGLLIRFLEHVSVLVIEGGIAERLILAEYADNFERLWEALREPIYLRRKAFGPYAGAAFEHLAMRARAFRTSGAMARRYAALERDPRGGAPGPERH